jgi:hypothetical protein
VYLTVPDRERINKLRMAAKSDSDTRVMQLPKKIVNYGQGLAQLRR